MFNEFDGAALGERSNEPVGDRAMNYAIRRSMRHSSAGCVGLEQRIERSFIAHPAVDAQVVQIGGSVRPSFPSGTASDDIGVGGHAVAQGQLREQLITALAAVVRDSRRWRSSQWLT